MKNIDKKKLLKTVLTLVLVLVVGYIGMKTGLIGPGSTDHGETSLPIDPVVTGDPDTEAPGTKAPETDPPRIREDGQYSSKDDVALYIHTYGKLPSNFIKKADAEKLGWTGGSLDRYAKGKAIGGDYFGNMEKLLPTKKGRSYTECDIDTVGKSSRGTKRIVFSNDGLIYYTDDHYESFTLLYGTP